MEFILLQLDCCLLLSYFAQPRGVWLSLLYHVCFKSWKTAIESTLGCLFNLCKPISFTICLHAPDPHSSAWSSAAWSSVCQSLFCPKTELDFVNYGKRWNTTPYFTHKFRTFSFGKSGKAMAKEVFSAGPIFLSALIFFVLLLFF